MRNGIREEEMKEAKRLAEELDLERFTQQLALTPEAGKRWYAHFNPRPVPKVSKENE